MKMQKNDEQFNVETSKEQLLENVPFAVYESSQVRAERHIKRLWIALIVETIAIVAIVASFLIYLSLYDFQSYEITAQGDGHANFIGQDGDIINGGESESQAENPQEGQS